MFSKEETEKIAIAIEKAETQTSGEIRVVVDKNCTQDPLDAAWNSFEQLNMHKTRLRNGVLIYIAYVDKKLAIIGDEGIHKKVPGNFWDCTKEVMIDAFKAGEFTKGVILGIAEAGKQLQKYFPQLHDDINELSNDIVILDDKEKSE